MANEVLKHNLLVALVHRSDLNRGNKQEDFIFHGIVGDVPRENLRIYPCLFLY